MIHGLNIILMDQLENEINQYAAKLISSKLGSNAASDYTISPFRISSSKNKGKQLGGYINQNDQLQDFESWAGPGNYVYHVIPQRPIHVNDRSW